jgi:hypothetical protein
MLLSHTRRQWLITVFLAIFAARGSAQAQTQTTTPFEPKSGQPGKDVVWVPTPDALVEKMLDMTRVTSSDYVVDLGSGDGRTVIAAAKRGATALGVEYNPDMVALSQRNATVQGVAQRASFVKADIFETDFSKATVVTMFLLPSINVKLRPKLLEMRPGTRIASNAFDMEDWEADEIATIPACTQWCRALLWIVPAKVQGSWRSPQGEIVFTQKFQKLSGTLSAGGIPEALQGTLSGDQITFKTERSQYSGRVNANAISGTVTSAGATTSWQATRVSK